MIREEEPFGLASFALVDMVGTCYDVGSYLHNSVVHLDELAFELDTWHVLAYLDHPDVAFGLLACVDQDVLLDLDVQDGLNGPIGLDVLSGWYVKTDQSVLAH